MFLMFCVFFLCLGCRAFSVPLLVFCVFLCVFVCFCFVICDVVPFFVLFVCVFFV